eukprot:jgi/Chrpa1/13633/Chrysochromulina_OHIO_Genome00020886-RA
MADVASLFGGDAADDTASLFGGAAPGYDPYGQPAAAAAPLGSPWTTGFTPEGFQYWFNESTGESSWYPPADMPPDTVSGAAQVPSATDQSIYSSAPSDTYGYGQQAGAADGSEFFNATPAATDGSDFFNAPPAATDGSDFFGTASALSVASDLFGAAPPGALPVAADLFGAAASQPAVPATLFGAPPSGPDVLALYPAASDLFEKEAWTAAAAPSSPVMRAMMEAAAAEAEVEAEGTAYAEVPVDSPWVGPGYTDEGYPYWYNNLTGESSWVDPHAPPQAA